MLQLGGAHSGLHDALINENRRRKSKRDIFNAKWGEERNQRLEEHVLRKSLTKFLLVSIYFIQGVYNISEVYLP